MFALSNTIFRPVRSATAPRLMLSEIAAAFGKSAGDGGPPLMFIDGKKAATLRGPTLTADFKQMVTDYIERRFGRGARAAE